MVVLIKRSGAVIRRALDTGANSAIAGGDFLDLLSKLMNLPPFNIVGNVGDSLSLLSPTVAKHIMLTVEGESIAAYMYDADLPGPTSGPNKVKKFNGGNVSESGSGVTWTFVAEGDVTPHPSGETPQIYPFLLFRKADIS